MAFPYLCLQKGNTILLKLVSPMLKRITKLHLRLGWFSCKRNMSEFCGIHGVGLFDN